MPSARKLMLMCTYEGTVTGFGLANPKLTGEREQARRMLTDHPANRPAPGTAIITDKGLAGAGTEEFFARLPEPSTAVTKAARPARMARRPSPSGRPKPLPAGVVSGDARACTHSGWFPS